MRLNHMPNGAACSACRDRLLDSLGAALPADLMRIGESHPLAEGEEPEMVSPRIAPDALEPEASDEGDDGPDDGGYKPSA
ncbi:MAG: hypothetical protein AAF264_14730 [Pseudomonadota bacterium]